MSTVRRPGAFFYGWVVVAVAFAVILIGAGTRSAPGALLLGIEADTGWSKGEIALAGAAGLLLLGLGGPLSSSRRPASGCRRSCARCGSSSCCSGSSAGSARG
jgi:hypothetical protein